MAKRKAAPLSFAEWWARNESHPFLSVDQELAKQIWNIATHQAVKLVEETLVSKNYLTGEPDTRSTLADAADRVRRNLA